MTGKNEPNQNTTVNSQSLTEKLAALYRSQNTLPKLIEDTKIKAQSLDEYYVKLQILLSEDDEAGKAALRDKVVGEKKKVEPENIFKAIDTEKKVRELLSTDDLERIKRIINIINTEKEESNKINLVDKELGNKNNIEEIKNIIESINRIQADIGKILLLGGAGVGKTTLLHNISYKWGKGDLWNDKFDYVFRVKLKELLNESWSREYEPSELRQDKLSCFIHYCLMHSDGTKFTKPEKVQLLKDILSIEKKQRDKVLLLLDGYDEVAHLNMSNRNDFQDIMDEISEYKNVIMSSRPNALIEGMSNGFERKVENTGWDKEGIDKYVDKNFENDKVLGMQLKSFLAVNSQIKEICEVPINTALVCLVWGDPKTRERLQKDTNEDFNISQLYQEVVIWLGKKYFQKFENKEVVNITDQQIFLKEEVQFLQKVAYESLVKTGKLVESDIIKKNLGKLDIGEINKFGLLKAEGTGREIINLNHQFIHLTFQEYLAARYLKDQLANNEAKSKAASFIGEHRNEPKYLMTLKFLAGIVANEDKDQNLAIRFWEAVTCNVDGILELGLETKVTLLMHILVQSKVSGKLDSGIPNLKQIQQLIDDTILKDITNWEQQIIESGYLSEAIMEVLRDKELSRELQEGYFFWKNLCLNLR